MGSQQRICGLQHAAVPVVATSLAIEPYFSRTAVCVLIGGVSLYMR